MRELRKGDIVFDDNDDTYAVIRDIVKIIGYYNNLESDMNYEDDEIWGHWEASEEEAITKFYSCNTDSRGSYALLSQMPTIIVIGNIYDETEKKSLKQMLEE